MNRHEQAIERANKAVAAAKEAEHDELVRVLVEDVELGDRDAEELATLAQVEHDRTQDAQAAAHTVFQTVLKWYDWNEDIAQDAADAVAMVLDIELHD